MIGDSRENRLYHGIGQTGDVHGMVRSLIGPDMERQTLTHEDHNAYKQSIWNATSAEGKRAFIDAFGEK